MYFVQTFACNAWRIPQCNTEFTRSGYHRPRDGTPHTVMKIRRPLSHGVGIGKVALPNTCFGVCRLLMAYYFENVQRGHDSNISHYQKKREEACCVSVGLDVVTPPTPMGAGQEEREERGMRSVFVCSWV